MKKNKIIVLSLLGVVGCSVLAGLSKHSQFSVKADDGYTVYKNSDLGIPNYGDNYGFGPTSSNHHADGASLSSKAELQITFKYNVKAINTYFAVGGYGIYTSSGSTVRLLYLNTNADGSDSRSYDKRDLTLKDSQGNNLTSVMPSNILFSDYVDVNYKVDLTGEYATTSLVVSYKDVEYHLYSGDEMLSSFTYTHKSSFTDTVFRVGTADSLGGDSTSLMMFKPAPGDKGITNGGQFSYSGTNLSLICEDEAASNNVPEGYDGSVLRLKDDASKVKFDFTDGNFEINENLRLTLRLYSEATPNGKYPEFRANNKDGGWAFNGEGDFAGSGGFSLSTVCNQWFNFVLTSDMFINGTTWNDFASKINPNILGEIEFLFRPKATSFLYIDSVKVDYIPNKADEFTNHGEFDISKGDGTNTILSYDEMATEGVGAGYEDAVLKLTGNVSASIFVDYNSSNIPLNLVQSIKIGCYATGTPNGKKPEFRLQATNASSRGLSDWIFMGQTDPYVGDGGYSMAKIMNTWHEFEISASTLKDGIRDIESETHKGYLGKFKIIYRCLDTTDCLYIDYIKLTLKPNDNVGPVIFVDCGDSILMPCNSIPRINAQAFDAQDYLATEVSESWSPVQAFDAQGRVQNKGTFTVTLSSKDFYGNTSTKSLTVVVGDEDNTAPLIDIPFDTIKLKAGTKFVFDASRYISDDYEFEYEVGYSSGMLDINSKVLTGTHTITIKASDLSGNVASKVITVIVSNDYVDDTEVIDEEKTFGDYAVVEEFCQTYLMKDGISVDDHSDTGNCLTYYSSAKKAFNELTGTQKDLFNTSLDFADMKDRMVAWALANGEVFNGLGFETPTSHILNLRSSSNSLMAVIVFSSFLAIVVTSYVVISKRKKPNCK